MKDKTIGALRKIQQQEYNFFLIGDALKNSGAIVANNLAQMWREYFFAY